VHLPPVLIHAIHDREYEGRRPADQQDTGEAFAMREHIREVLRETNGVVAGPRGAALRLGLKRTTLLSRMKKLGITTADVSTVWN